MKKLITWITVISMIVAYGAEAAAYVPDYKEKVKGVTMIPSSGIGAYADQVIHQINYLYDSTWPDDPDIGKIYWETTFNDQDTPGIPNIRISTEQLQTELPNNKWIALTIGWQLDFEQLEVRPMVEKKEEFEQETITIREQGENGLIVFKQYVRTIRKNVLIDEATYQRAVSNGYVIEAPQSYWKVGSEDRNTARLIDPSITYGETPSDQEIIEAVRYYKSQGYQVMIYPFLLGYRADKPWRGRLVLSSAAQVHHFMTKSTGYNQFIRHYIQLLKNERIDGFLVGSEMEALTLSASPEYPAVDHLIQLIHEAKAAFGSHVQVSYAANWSEYHHDPSNGYYHLDKLWKEADFVGIDAYFPLTEQHSVDYQEIYNGWQSGEYFDYYYAGSDYQNRLPLQEKYAIKNIQYWWENKHFNPDGSQTDWVPRSKKIWLTELGFASVNSTTVQPNIFVDPTSSEGGYPRGSNRETSVMAQAAGLDASLDFLNTQPWIGNVFVWTWDARPFPAFPLSSFWSDGGNWEQGHWLQGKTHPSISGNLSVETLRREYPEYTDSQSLVADPIDTSTGAHVMNKNLLQLNGLFSFDFNLHYNSLLTSKGPFGHSWAHEYDVSLEVEGTESIKVHWDRNRYNVFSASGNNTFLSSDKNTKHDTLYKKVDGTYELKRNNQAVYHFNSQGKLIRQTNKFGQALLFTYTGERLHTISEPVSSYTITLVYNTEGLIEKLSDNENQSFEFQYDSKSDLIEMTDRTGSKTKYVYDNNHKVLSSTNDEGVIIFQNRYDDYGRIASQQDARDNITTFLYDESTFPGKLRTFVKNRRGYIKTYIHNKRYQLEKIVDEHKKQTAYEYDLDGNRVLEVDAAGQEKRMTYDIRGNLLTSTNENAVTTVYSYDDRNNVLSITNGLNERMQFQYDLNNRLIRITGPENNVSIYHYNAQGNLSSIVKPNGSQLQYEYNSLGQLSKSVDGTGKETLFEYNGNGQLSKTIAPDGSTTARTYDFNGRLTQLIDAKQHSTTYQYNSHGDVLSSTDANGNTTTNSYNGNGLLESTSNPLGQKTSYAYNAEDQIIKITNPEGESERFNYDIKGRLIEEIDTEDNVKSYKYDDLDRIIRVTNAAGDSRHFAYDPAGNVIQETDERGNVRGRQYDALNRITQTIDAYGKKTLFEYNVSGKITKITSPLSQIVRFDYDPNGNKIRETDPKGNFTIYTYDANDRMIKETNPLNQSKIYGYDDLGRLSQVTDASGNLVSSYSYDSVGLLVSSQDAFGNAAESSYDANGNIIGTTDRKGTEIQTVHYNELNLPVMVTDALGYSNHYEYTQLALPETETNPLGQNKRYHYNSRGELLTVTDAMGAIASQQVDVNGRIVEIVDAMLNPSRFRYDAAGNLIEKDFSGEKVLYQYDRNNRIDAITNARGQISRYLYDDAGRIESFNTPEGPVVYEYDENNNITRIYSNNQLSAAYQYDALNRITEYTDSFQNKIKYEYDTVGNLKTLIYPGGKRVSYTYDSNRRLSKVVDWLNRETRYIYDENDQVVEIHKADGSTEYRDYDSRGQLLHIRQQTASGETINTYRYEYDSNGNVIVGETEIFEADFDNTAPTSMTYSADNRLAAYQGQNVQHDSDGNMITGPLKGVMSPFSYDSRNRLIQAGNLSYEYNELDERVQVTKNGLSSRYVINPNSKLSQLLMETDESGNVIATYVYGLGLIGREDADGSYQVYHYDRHGSTTALTNAGGSITDRYNYDPYGSLLDHIGGTDQPFQYNGMYGVMTEANGLLYMRARYYNPEIKRFINRDLVQGHISVPLSLNSYAYANGNPISYVDPFGLSRDSDGLHLFLDGVGLIPVIGEVADGLNAVIYTFEGDYVNAGLSATSMIPVAGWLSTGAKFGKRVFDSKVVKQAVSACNCFTAGTQVLTDEGEKNIEDIEVGDRVLAKDENNPDGELGYKEVTNLYRNQRDDIIKLYVGEQIIETTDNHPFWVEGKGWVFADELQVGDKLQKADGSNLTIDKVEFVKLDEPVTVYNFTVADFHTYYVTDLGIWVHNTNCGYKDITVGKSVRNIETNVTRADFEKSLIGDGWKKSVSKDGKVTIYSKDGAQYTVRDTSNQGQPTAEFWAKGATEVTTKIRLGSSK